jgi:hypothetical protein
MECGHWAFLLENRCSAPVCMLFLLAKFLYLFSLCVLGQDMWILMNLLGFLHLQGRIFCDYLYSTSIKTVALLLLVLKGDE